MYFNGILFSLLIILTIITTMISYASCGYHSIKTIRKMINNQSPSQKDKPYRIRYNNLISKDSFNNSDLQQKVQSLIQIDNSTSSNNPRYFTSVSLDNYFNIQYYGPVYIGSTDQKLSVIFDTGSNLFWVASALCTICRNYTKKYNPNLSSTVMYTNERRNITYAVGFVDGTFIEDSVKVNSISSFLGNHWSPELGVDGFRILLVNEEKQLEGTIADGVMGLGIDNEGNQKNSYVHSLYKNGKIRDASFSFYLTENRADSRLYLGDILENSYMKEFLGKPNSCQVPNQSNYWLCTMNKITLTNYDDVTSSFVSTSKIIFDSGTSYIIIPAIDMVGIVSYLNNNTMNRTCNLSKENQLNCQCSSPKEFGMMVLTIDNSTFTINFEETIDFMPATDFACKFQILADVFFEDAWILGDSALRSTLISFNMNSKSIQWVKTKERINELALAESMNKINTAFWIWTAIGISVLLLCAVAAYFALR